jgi:enoyl-CoA hydratase/carnithine racemase
MAMAMEMTGLAEKGVTMNTEKTKPETANAETPAAATQGVATQGAEVFSTVTLTIADHMAHLRLNRPEKRNAVSLEMITEFIAACEVLMESDARVVVLSGAGQGFCSGLDTSALGAFLQQDATELVMPRSHGDANMFQQFALGLRALPMPVIAALDGVCFGAGFQLALGADSRIAAPDTRLSVMEMRWGLVPDMGIDSIFN